MRFRLIEQHARTWLVRLMCRVLQVSPSGYYEWRSRLESIRSAANRQLLEDVRRIHAGRSASRGCVERLIRRYGIQALAGRRFRPCTTDSRHDLPIVSNLLKQKFSASVPNPLRLADIT